MTFAVFNNERWKKATSFERITTGCLVHLVAICVILYIFIFHVIDHIDALRPIQDACLTACHTPFCQHALTHLRGRNYYLHAVDKSMEITKCLLTTWEVSHFLFHMYVGYYYNIYISLGLGVIFEIYEHLHLGCGSFLDLFWNTCGFWAGHYLREWMSRFSKSSKVMSLADQSSIKQDHVESGRARQTKSSNL